jgi:hypothetical protein
MNRYTMYASSSSYHPSCPTILYPIGGRHIGVPFVLTRGRRVSKGKVTIAIALPGIVRLWQISKFGVVFRRGREARVFSSHLRRRKCVKLSGPHRCLHICRQFYRALDRSTNMSVCHSVPPGPFSTFISVALTLRSFERYLTLTSP